LAAIRADGGDRVKRNERWGHWRLLVAVPLVSLMIAACGASRPGPRPLHLKAFPTRTAPIPAGIRKIKHVVIIMQENRSFDSYFGTYPGADGIPGVAGNPGKPPCVPNPLAKHKQPLPLGGSTEGSACVAPFHDQYDSNEGGPHGISNSLADVNRGAMNGFIGQAQHALHGCAQTFNPACGGGGTSAGLDVMGYHTGADVPNYWTYARDFVLQDHMFEGIDSWSLPSHLYLASEWSAFCSVKGDPWSCQTAPEQPGYPPDAIRNASHTVPDYAWTDLTYLLHRNHVSWGFYVFTGSEPDCENSGSVACAPVPQRAKTPGIWNVLPYFDTVRDDGQLGNIQTLSHFFAAARAGTLPAVSWITPNAKVSEHPPSLVSAGQTYVTGLINAVMRSPDWNSSAIFLSWDDWGGFYDHVVPPSVDQNGYGIRVPGLVISPYTKRGYIDHQTLSFDAYSKFIEDDFLGGQRLDPRIDGRPDLRPDVREDAPQLGNLIADFNFNQRPLPPLILPVHPKTDLVEQQPQGPPLPLG
jgi:phospholipase C